MTERGRRIIAFMLVLGGAPLSAQTVVPPLTHPGITVDCSMRLVDADGKSGPPICSVEGHLAFVLRATGLETTQLWVALESGAAARGIYALSLSKGIKADSAVYGIIEVKRSGNAGYRINTMVGGGKYPADACASYGGEMVDDWPIALGAMVSSAAQRLTRCVQALKLAGN
jgi:hypothetical protein